MPEPVCPNDKLDDLREMVEEAARDWDHKIGQHNMEAIAEVLARLRDAQTAGRVLADPEDSRLWDFAMRAKRAQRMRS